MVRPHDVLTWVHHGPVDPVTVAVARVLGARHLAQAAATVYRPSRELVAAGVYSDAAHAVSMVGLAVVSAAHRRAGLIDAAIALALALVGSPDLPGPVSRDRAGGRGAVLARRVLVRLPGGSVLLNSARPR